MSDTHYGPPEFTDPSMIALPEDFAALVRERGGLAPAPGGIPPLFNNGNTPQKLGVQVVSLKTFVTVTEDVAEPLIGSSDDSLLPADGLLLMYGDGGAGKTTLSIDALAHLASGTEWLGISVPNAIRVLLIENEGPRGPFRRRLGQKIAAWRGDDFHQNVVVLEEPWQRFTLTDTDYRRQLASEISKHDVDLVIVGPLASLGAKGTGTPDEINEFDVHVKDLRAHAHREFALWIVHHENKQGDVSGAWERYPDSLVHVQAQGNGQTKVVWRKVRWSSSLHGTSTTLAWAEGHGFDILDKPNRDLRLEILRWLTGKGWSTVAEIGAKDTGIGANNDKIRQIVSLLTEDGDLEHAKGRAAGRTNANAKCWRLKPKPNPLISTDSEPLSQYESVDHLAGSEPATDSLTRPISETGESQLVGGTPTTDSTNPSQYDELDEQDRAMVDYYHEQEAAHLAEENET